MLLGTCDRFSVRGFKMTESGWVRIICPQCGRKQIVTAPIYHQRKKNSKSGNLFCSTQCNLKWGRSKAGEVVK